MSGFNGSARGHFTLPFIPNSNNAKVTIKKDTSQNPRFKIDFSKREGSVRAISPNASTPNNNALSKGVLEIVRKQVAANPRHYSGLVGSQPEAVPTKNHATPDILPPNTSYIHKNPVSKKLDPLPTSQTGPGNKPSTPMNPPKRENNFKQTLDEQRQGQQQGPDPRFYSIAPGVTSSQAPSIRPISGLNRQNQAQERNTSVTGYNLLPGIRFKYDPNERVRGHAEPHKGLVDKIIQNPTMSKEEQLANQQLSLMEKSFIKGEKRLCTPQRKPSQ